MPFNYGDLQAEMDCINQAYLEVMTEGDAKGRVFTFKHLEQQAANQLFSSRKCGNNITSRIDGEFVNNMTKRSIPIPSPAVGGMPYSNARI